MVYRHPAPGLETSLLYSSWFSPQKPSDSHQGRNAALSHTWLALKGWHPPWCTL